MAGVQSIERAFAILRALAVQPSGVTELAQRVDLPKSTVARLLGALESEGAIEQIETAGNYRIGSAIEEIAGGSSQGKSLIAAAQPFLIDLAQRTDEATGLDLYDNGTIDFIDLVPSDQDVQIRDWTGESGPAHSLPAGLVVLAQLSDAEIDAYIARGLEAMTPNTITDGDQLRERLIQVKSAGYAWVYEEFAEGINSVAAPIIGPDGPVGALRIHGPTFRFPNPDRSHDVGLLVADAAERLSEQLTAFTE